MKELLEKKGWVMYYECTLRCGHKQFYNHPQHKGYEVTVKGPTFTIKLNNSVICGPLSGYQMEDSLKKFVN